jgi:glycosidase
LEEVGVDGFRLDAAKHIIEEGTSQANTASTHAWWEKIRPFYKEVKPQAITIAEIWDDPKINAEYLQGDEVDLSFDFYLAAYFITALNDGKSDIVKEQIELGYSLVPPQQFATFLTNHDQDRLMTQLGNDPRKVKAAASLLLTAPGVPFLYYGEEIGMQGGSPHELVRCPMQWSAEQFSGFSTVSPWQEAGPGWENYNVANESSDQTSILSHYRTLIRVRNQHSALRVGQPVLLNTGNDGLYGILRVSEGETVLVLINLTGEPITDYKLSLEASSLTEGGHTPFPILGEGTFVPLPVDSGGGFFEYVPVPIIQPYATLILQL